MGSISIFDFKSWIYYYGAAKPKFIYLLYQTLLLKKRTYLGSSIDVSYLSLVNNTVDLVLTLQHKTENAAKFQHLFIAIVRSHFVVMLTSVELETAKSKITEDVKLESLLQLRENTRNFLIQCLADREIQKLIHQDERLSFQLFNLII